MEASYEPESDYHSGSIPEQEAKAQLGVFKHTSDVPPQHQLSNVARNLDPDDIWTLFMQKNHAGVTYHNGQYKYWSPWSKWCEFCEGNDTHPLAPTDEDVDEWFTIALEDSASRQTCHDIHFRLLYNIFQWLTEHTDYPHCYNPVLQSALLKGAGHELWEERVFRRKKYEDRYEINK